MKREYFIQVPCQGKWRYWGNVIIGQGYDSKEKAEQAGEIFFRNNQGVKPEDLRIVYVDYIEEAPE